MALGKHRNSDEPLTEHDVAERLSGSIKRTWTILLQARELGMMDGVKTSRYLVGGGFEGLSAELEHWQNGGNIRVALTPDEVQWLFVLVNAVKDESDIAFPGLESLVSKLEAAYESEVAPDGKEQYTEGDDNER